MPLAVRAHLAEQSKPTYQRTVLPGGSSIAEHAHTVSAKKINVNIHNEINKQINIYIYIYISVHIYIYIYTHIHTYTHNKENKYVNTLPASKGGTLPAARAESPQASKRIGRRLPTSAAQGIFGGYRALGL